MLHAGLVRNGNGTAISLLYRPFSSSLRLSLLSCPLSPSPALSPPFPRISSVLSSPPLSLSLSSPTPTTAPSLLEPIPTTPLLLLAQTRRLSVRFWHHPDSDDSALPLGTDSIDDLELSLPEVFDE